jgi:Zn-dependent peptidase ImmA (M78 family)
MFAWAAERSGRDVEAIVHRFPKLPDWEAGTAKPTMRQLENFAKATYTPVGYLFLAEPPREELPIPDFRTMASRQVRRPSPNLLETIYACQERQTWYREHVRTNRGRPLPLVGSVTPDMDPIVTAQRLREALHFSIEDRRRCPTWSEALRMFLSQVDQAGVMVMVSGVVGNNNTRKLDPQEFRGFALSDDFAPLIFVNGADTKAGQMFTLAHELAHIYLGQTALSDQTPAETPSNDIERWCNRVAAEFLVPLDVFQRELRPDESPENEAQRLARYFKVSTLVILRRMLDAGRLSFPDFRQIYEEELERLLALTSEGGGNFYLTQGARLSKRFARAVILDAYEGNTLFRDAQRLLGVQKMKTLVELGRKLDLPI